MDIADWRQKIDELDRQIVHLLSERAVAVQAIGCLKNATKMPVYEPARESVVFENVRKANAGPLPNMELTHIYERIIDVMRSFEKNNFSSQQEQAGGKPKMQKSR